MTTDYFAGDPRTNLERMLAGDPYIADQEIEDLTRRSARLAEAYGRVALLDDEAVRGRIADMVKGR